MATAKGIDDSFDEVFKLIYAKLYDEWAAANDPTRNRKIRFRIYYGESPREPYDKINGLLIELKTTAGFLVQDERIRLKPEHLLTSVSFLQDVKLFNATRSEALSKNTA